MKPPKATRPGPCRRPKKAGRSDPVKTLLPADEVPESYIDAFDTLRETEHRAENGKIKVSGARKVFEGSGIDTTEQERIVKLVIGGQETPLGRSEFNVLLALIGLSLESEEVSLDSVDERRRSETSSTAERSFQQSLIKRQIYLNHLYITSIK